MIHLELSRAGVNCLANHLPLGSDLRYKVLSSDTIPGSGGLSIGDSNLFDFSEGEARELLRIAVEHCPDAVEKIQYGMNVAGIG